MIDERVLSEALSLVTKIDEVLEKANESSAIAYSLSVSFVKTKVVSNISGWIDKLFLGAFKRKS